jgi:hypothetical protein
LAWSDRHCNPRLRELLAVINPLMKSPVERGSGRRVNTVIFDLDAIISTS